MISVCIITYNHEKYILEALKSVLAQKDVVMEVIIGDDCSSDNTITIIKDFVLTNTLDWKVLPNDRNVGMINNWERCIKSASMKYVALLEGDDYWTDTYKLKKQIDVLELNTKISFCFHPVNVVFNDVPEVNHLQEIYDRNVFSTCDLVNEKWFVPTCSIVYKRELLPFFPNWFFSKKAVYKSVQLVLSLQGDFIQISEYMGIYRIHSNGISQIQWLGKENIFEFSIIPILKDFDIFSKKQFHSVITKRISSDYEKLMRKNKVNSTYFFKAFVGYISCNQWNILKIRPIIADLWYSSIIYRKWRTII